ncbi:hypothetical protein FNH13_14720 [Ornithinimicrobium ciconiae]|uniref:Uncharacterized protein n=1 Tax=Ornithinimicrobium ciconiae TaxID=2594265 RepID=A0A516GD28_9MICO|nr:hypothetical protein [Ornithinimicrobium ciconiae]QDO89426.1 hypothetical protein FNH13_14720 [Ornithinimicrobium ciconiae]
METLHPSEYPWAEPLRAGLLRGDAFVPEACVDDLEGRVPVVAVGSNASPAVLRHKLGPLLSTGVPLAVVQVEGLAVGHSAHVSARGYIAAAPFRSEGAHEAVVAWFDTAQLATLDATEPNYRRIPLPDDMSCRQGDVSVAGAEVYASVHGVLGEDSTPLSLRDQISALSWLAHRLPAPIASALNHGSLREANTRERVRGALIEAGLVLPSGL